MAYGADAYGSLAYGGSPTFTFSSAGPSEAVFFISSREFDRATIVASSEASTLLAAYLQNPDPAAKWRTTSKVGQFLKMTLARPVACNALAIKHSLTGAGMLRVTGALTLAGLSSPISDSGWVSAWPLGAKPSDEDWPSYCSLVRWDNENELSCWQLEVADIGVGTSYIEIARLWIGRGYQPPYDVDQSVGLGLNSPDVQLRSDYGKTFIDPRGDATRQFVLPFSAENHRDLMDSLFELQRYVGIGRDFAFFLDPAATTDFHKYAMQAVFNGGAQFEAQPMFDGDGQVWRTSLTLNELL
jgi:hypothetical protein